MNRAVTQALAATNGGPGLTAAELAIQFGHKLGDPTPLLKPVRA